MSYPNLGCFSECLKCEICDKGLDDDELDLNLPEDYGDGWDDDPLSDWEPEPEQDEGGMWDDLSIPGISLPGGGEATPGWNNGPSIILTWPWD